MKYISYILEYPEEEWQKNNFKHIINAIILSSFSRKCQGVRTIIKSTNYIFSRKEKYFFLKRRKCFRPVVKLIEENRICLNKDCYL